MKRSGECNICKQKQFLKENGKIHIQSNWLDVSRTAVLSESKNEILFTPSLFLGCGLLKIRSKLHFRQPSYEVSPNRLCGLLKMQIFTCPIIMKIFFFSYIVELVRLSNTMMNKSRNNPQLYLIHNLNKNVVNISTISMRFAVALL